MSKWIFGLNKYFEAALDRLAPRFLVVAHSKILSHVGDPVLESIVKYVSLGDCAVDIGANRGIYTRKLSIQVGRLGEVFAFEPYPPKVRTLRTVCARRKNVRVFDSGVSDRNGFAQLVVPRLFGLALDTLASLGAESPGCSRFAVSISPLDETSVIDSRISFMKIDVEGHELAVLRGSRKIILRDRPVIVCEVDQRLSDEPIELTFQFVQSLGYEIFACGRHSSKKPLLQFDKTFEQLELPKASSVATNRATVDFLFLPKIDGRGSE